MKKIIRSCISFFLRRWPLKNIKIIRLIIETSNTPGQVTFRTWFIQKVLGFNKAVYWPVHHSSVINGWNNIKIGISTAPGLSPGCYIQGQKGIEIGDYTIIAPNVGIVSANHSVYDFRKHEGEKIVIGSYCWIGMGAIVLSGVKLGNHTIVAASSVVNKSFEEGYCIIGGVPARVLKHLNKADFVEYEAKHKYYGYVREKDFESFRKEKLTL